MLLFSFLFAEDFDSFEDEFAQEESVVLLDPLSGYNRIMTTFNDFLFEKVIFPIADVYADVVPKNVRVNTEHFFSNLYSPVSIVNNLLQLKIEYATHESIRLFVNTLMGLGGFIDVAKSEYGLEPHTEDFGQTLGHWGVGSGFHIVLPFFGPSNLRDALGVTVDYYLEPMNRIDPRGYNALRTDFEAISQNALYRVNDASLNKGEYKILKKDALDLYPFLRDAYEQHRQKVINE